MDIAPVDPADDPPPDGLLGLADLLVGELPDLALGLRP
jgi:hypothetical protein